MLVAGRIGQGAQIGALQAIARRQDRSRPGRLEEWKCHHISLLTKHQENVNIDVRVPQSSLLLASDGCTPYRSGSNVLSTS